MCLGVPFKILEIDSNSAIGEVVTVEHGGAYSYLEVKEHTEATFWVAVNRTEVKVGDYVMVHAGFAIEKMKEDDAKCTIDAVMEVQTAARELRISSRKN